MSAAATHSARSRLEAVSLPRSGAAVEVTVIIPTFNEAGGIAALLSRIEAAVVGKAIACEVLVMDDSPTEETVLAARSARLSIPLRAMRRTGPRGLSEAVTEGIREARGEYIVVMDADLQHPPEALPEMVRLLRGGAEFVIGSRHTAGGKAMEFSPLRRLNSWGATVLARPLVKGTVTDPMSGFFGCPRRLATGAELNATGYKIGLELLVKTGATRISETPIQFGKRFAGESKLSWREQVRYLRHLGRLYAWRFSGVARFARFCAVGACGMAVDLTLMTLLVSAGLRFPAARTWSILAALPVNFLLNCRWTFRAAADPRAAGAFAQFLRFAGACSLGLIASWAISNGLYALLSSWRGAYQLLCAAGIVAGTAANYHFSRTYAFAVPREDRC